MSACKRRILARGTCQTDWLSLSSLSVARCYMPDYAVADASSAQISHGARNGANRRTYLRLRSSAYHLRYTCSASQ